MEAIIDLIQVQFRAGFEDDAIRSMAVFDWAVRDSADRRDAARNLALGGTRLAEIGRRDLARRLFDEALTVAARLPQIDGTLLREIESKKVAAGF